MFLHYIDSIFVGFKSSHLGPPTSNVKWEKLKQNMIKAFIFDTIKLIHASLICIVYLTFQNKIYTEVKAKARTCSEENKFTIEETKYKQVHIPV